MQQAIAVSVCVCVCEFEIFSIERFIEAIKKQQLLEEVFFNVCLLKLFLNTESHGTK